MAFMVFKNLSTSFALYFISVYRCQLSMSQVKDSLILNISISKCVVPVFTVVDATSCIRKFDFHLTDFDLCVASTKSSLTCSLFKFMNHIVLKPNILYPTELYALSKPAALGNISVRTSTMNDIENIEHLLVHYEEKVTIVKDLMACLICPDENTTYKMVTICVDKNIIGKNKVVSIHNFCRYINI